MRHLSAFASPAQEPSRLEVWAKRHGIRAQHRTLAFGRWMSVTNDFGFSLRTNAYEEYVSVTVALGWPRINFSVNPRWFPKSFLVKRHRGISINVMRDGFSIEVGDEYYGRRYFWSRFYDQGSYLALDETWKPNPRIYDKSDHAWFEHPYVYVLPGGDIQQVTATVRRSSCRSRWHWFGGAPGSKKEKLSEWFRNRMPFGTKEVHYIEVTFSDEIGPQAGSYKGGVIQTTFLMKDDEYAEKALYRMMREKVFR
jgi:hypothetical protein